MRTAERVLPTATKPSDERRRVAGKRNTLAFLGRSPQLPYRVVTGKLTLNEEEALARRLHTDLPPNLQEHARPERANDQKVGVRAGRAAGPSHSTIAPVR